MKEDVTFTKDTFEEATFTELNFEGATFTRVNFVEQAEAIEHILQSAVKQILSIQKRLGNPISIWRDGKVVIVPPEEIVISPEFLESET